MEARVVKLESHFGYIRRDLESLCTDVREIKGDMRDEFKTVRTDMREDFRILFSALAVVAVGMAGLMASGFGWL